MIEWARCQRECKGPRLAQNDMAGLAGDACSQG
jgi:hypothetical protein